MVISLTGFMGSGKSSVARELATLLCCSYIDLDEYIEKAEEKTITEIFEEGGEKTFRAMEFKYLKDVLEKSAHNLILSLGGGTIMTSECKTLIMAETTPVYLQAQISTLVKNLEDQTETRPMLKGEVELETRIRELMDKREATYKECAEFIINTDGLSPKAIAEKIKEELI
jgi:shikimate kinase